MLKTENFTKLEENGKWKMRKFNLNRKIRSLVYYPRTSYLI